MSCSSEDVEKILPCLNIKKAGLGWGGGALLFINNMDLVVIKYQSCVAYKSM